MAAAAALARSLGASVCRVGGNLGRRPLASASVSAAAAGVRSPAVWAAQGCAAQSLAPPQRLAAGAVASAAAALFAGMSLDAGRRRRLAAAAPTRCEGDDRSHELSVEEQRTVALFEKSSQSVVHINTFRELRRGFFGLDAQEIPQGTGSGFVWDSQHIVTNFHVIKDADTATVVLADGTSCKAQLVGVEPDCDLAVLKVAVAGKRTLVPLERGRSSNLKVGQRVLAIGNPFGLDQTLTSGIVSGLGREMSGVTGRRIRNLVQTDAAINPGNSGGPLLDARGRLIGVNTMIASPSGAFSGVGFAIPVDTVVRVVEQLLKYGFLKRPYLGVYLLPDHVVAALRAQVGDRPLQGALVLNVERGSPAEAAGLRPTERSEYTGELTLGDEILEVNGRKIARAEDLIDAIEDQNIGDTVEIKYVRRSGIDGRGGVRTARTKLVERPGNVVQPASFQRDGLGGPHGPIRARL